MYCVYNTDDNIIVPYSHLLLFLFQFTARRDTVGFSVLKLYTAIV